MYAAGINSPLPPSNATIGPYAPKPLVPGVVPQATTLPATQTAPRPMAPQIGSVPGVAKPLVPASGPSDAYSGGSYGAVNGIDPVKVKSTTLEGMQPYIDAAYNQSASRLDPQYQQAEARFQQDMVNKGIQPGTQAGLTVFGVTQINPESGTEGNQWIGKIRVGMMVCGSAL